MSRPVRLSRLGVLFGRSALIVVGLLFSFLLMEGLLRAFGGFLPGEMQQIIRTPGSMGVAHPHIGHLHTPNNSFVTSGRDFRGLSHTDGHGFRNAWPWPARADIVVVGDSLTFGYGVSDAEAWPAILAQNLPSARVINLGLIGAGPQQYLRLYETFGIPLRPTVVVVGVFVGNDFWDADVFDRWVASHAGGNYMVWRDFGRPVPAAKTSRTARVKRWLLSTVYSLAKHSQVVSLTLAMERAVTQSISMKTEELSFADGSRLRLSHNQLIENTRGAQPGRREFQATIDAFQRMQQLARENGSHLLLVLQPSKEEVYSLRDRALPDPARPLREALQQLGIDYLDLGPIFRERAAAGRRLFFQVDGHPNAAGYALIAKAVLHDLERRRYLGGAVMRRPGS